MFLLQPIARGVLLSLACLAAAAHAQTTPAELLAGYTAQAGQPAQAARGQAFFTAKHGKDWSCSSCHTAKHAATGKVIAPLAPSANDKRFTDAAKSEKWFRRNCNDVAGRECTPGEKADVLAWLLTQKP